MTARKQDHNKGKILDCSIKSEYDLMQRCHIEEFTGCWIWRGTFARGSARVYVRLPGSEKGKVMNGGRAALCIREGKEPDRELRLEGYRLKCRNENCCNPDHCRWMTRKQIGEVLASEGSLKGNVRYMVSNKINARKRAKLTPELVREIRASDENNCQIARRLGVAHNTVRNVRVGLTWRDEAAVNSSVFAWRPAA
jgi:hypothetical protein